MKRLIILGLSTFGLAIAIYSTAFAGSNCTTTCNTNPYTHQQTCHTNCY